MTTVPTRPDTGGSDALLFWPSDHPWMTAEELVAWLPAAVEVATIEKTARHRAAFDDQLERYRNAIAELERAKAELVADFDERPPFVEVECPCCQGMFIVERRPGVDDDDTVTIAEHIATTDNPYCSRELWGSTEPMREHIKGSTLDADGSWRIVFPA